MAIETTSTPCIADARTAAEAVAVQGVSKVLLFGSVARGEAGPDSDIDLVAIHDDIDYSTRRDRSDRLGRRARDAAGCRVFVYVTDWPEWDHRSNKVSASLEYAITSDAVTLYQRAPNRVRWEKEIGLPRTNEGEAAARLRNTLRALFGVQAELRMSISERDALTDGDHGYYRFAIRDRMCLLCAHAHMAIETSLKALINLEGVRPIRTHDLVKLLETLPSDKRAEVRSLFISVAPEEASMWREAGAYEYADWSLSRLVPDTYHMATTSIAVARYAAARLSHSEVTRLIHKVVDRLEKRLERWDITADDPYEMIDQPSPPDVSY